MNLKSSYLFPIIYNSYVTEKYIFRHKHNFLYTDFEENVIPGQIDDNEGKVKKEVQFKTRGELAADDLQNNDRQQNGSTSSLTSIPSKPSKGGMCGCCRRKGKKDKRGSDEDEEKIVVGSEDNKKREELEIQNSESHSDFREASATSR